MHVATTCSYHTLTVICTRAANTHALAAATTCYSLLPHDHRCHTLALTTLVPTRVTLLMLRAYLLHSACICPCLLPNTAVRLLLPHTHRFPHTCCCLTLGTTTKCCRHTHICLPPHACGLAVVARSLLPHMRCCPTLAAAIHPLLPHVFCYPKGARYCHIITATSRFSLPCMFGVVTISHRSPCTMHLTKEARRSLPPSIGFIATTAAASIG